eukprot:363740-Chlamydomonas_euryale.AAC.5
MFKHSRRHCHQPVLVAARHTKPLDWLQAYFDRLRKVSGLGAFPLHASHVNSGGATSSQQLAVLVWGVSQDESTEIVHSFFESKHFLDGIPVVPGAYEALCRMAGDVELVVVTSRQHAIEDLTLDWLDANYPALFQEVYFGNHFAKEGVSRKKSEICKSIGAGVLIDDNPGYALECAEAGINVLLYDWEDKYPWSKLPAQKSHPLITVVRNWEEVEEAVAALMPETTSAIDLNL